ncbi:hypothetical protein D3C87_1103450 [compost metagenome]
MDTNAIKPTAPDWALIERDYRAGVKPLRTIAEEHGITHGAINKRAKRDEWTRDLRVKIQAKADALVAKAAVSKEVSAAAKASDRQIVEANATAIVNVRLAHRTDIRRARGVANNLLDELAGQTGPEAAALLAELGELLRKPDDKGQDKLNDLYQKVISLPMRVKSMKDLGDTLRVLVGLEREAFGISSEAPKDEGLSAVATAELLKMRTELSGA